MDDPRKSLGFAVEPTLIKAVLTPAMVADLWMCSEKHVRNLISSGELRSFKLGDKLLRILGEDVIEFMTRGASPPPDRVHVEIESASVKPRKKPAKRLDLR